MICKNCIHSEVCKHKTEAVYECEHFKDGTIKNQYDRIRNMSIEEMADVFDIITEICTEHFEKGCLKCPICKANENSGFCDRRMIVKWLESEVTE